MSRFQSEIEDLEIVRKIANKWGHGNCIQYLKHSWAEILHKNGLPKKASALGAGMCKEESKMFEKGFKITK